jgi:hypothetical protein
MILTTQCLKCGDASLKLKVRTSIIQRAPEYSELQ